MVDQTAIPCILMRGGTSRGPFFLGDDLPAEERVRDAVLLSILGSPHPLQVDGIGGGQAQTSKVAIVSRSKRADADVDYLFAQVAMDRAVVDTKPNCGNMLAGVGPFAIERGLVAATGAETLVRVHNVNTGTLVDELVTTPHGAVAYAGEQEIDGVDGTAAPIRMRFRQSVGSLTGSLLPSGRRIEEIAGVAVTLIDNAMPMMLIAASDLGLRGDESPEEIDSNRELFELLEPMRLEAGRRMGLGDVSDRVVPKIGLLSPARNGGAITCRYLMPHNCHRSHAVTGAICIATAAALENTVAANLAHGVTVPGVVTIEHPSGNIFVDVEPDPGDHQSLHGAVIRTARKIFEGSVYVPAQVWDGK